MKIMGIDYGDTRTGLAISDENEKLAFAAGTVIAKSTPQAAQEVVQKIKELHAKKIVLGLPKNMDGTEGFRAIKTRKFAACLSENLPGISIDFLDERLTTVAASYYFNQTNTRGQKRKQQIDALSAQIILQDYLDKNNIF